ncbi:hypothetical protein FAUST_6602 [Fusarium austroamericanum]|uniref:Methyltransferase n=1 Tax=Fusarium austroamericanum TaxID=282268 RepID=A0AAN5Z7Z0_FUSAU|nr:hypothetical protein FAUST_6602 [Fusarium austroamericanum]
MDPESKPTAAAQPQNQVPHETLKAQPWKSFMQEPEIHAFLSNDTKEVGIIRLKTEKDEHGLGEGSITSFYFLVELPTSKMVTATLNFISSLHRYEKEKPYFLNTVDQSTREPILRTNLEYSKHEGIQIENIRDHCDNAFTLNKNGFKVMSHRTVSFIKGQNIDVEAYCTEIVRLVAEECNAAHVLCYDYRIRKNNTELVNYEKDQDAGRSTAAPPVFPAHIDHTVEGGPKRILRHLTEREAVQYMNDQYRARIIKMLFLYFSVWRPLNNPVKDCPLAICDPRSIDTMDLLSADRVTPDFAVELYYLKHNANQKWYWLSNQTLDEITLFVNYDSNCRLEGSDWKTCPHAAFMNPEAQADSPPRESIEARLIVFTRSE